MQKRLKSVFICVFSILLMIFNGCVFVNKVDTTYELEYKKNKSFFENFKESWFSSTSEFLFLNKDTLSDDEYEYYKKMLKTTSFEQLVIILTGDKAALLLSKGDHSMIEENLTDKEKQVYVKYDDCYIMDFTWVYGFLGELKERDGKIFSYDEKVLLGVNAEFKDKNEILEIPSNVINIAGIAFNHTPIKKVIFNPNLKRVGPSAFIDSYVVEIKVNEGLKEIGEKAFNGCVNLRKIVIPKSVEVIYSEAFTSTAVYCEAESKPNGWADDFAVENAKVYYANEWHYDDAGNPVPNS